MFKLFNFVITSYSIHYTKLYDIGPVGEPYVQSFPLPEIFFNFLTKGKLTLAESYLVSLPYLSWKQVLVGDPLYRVKTNPDSALACF